MLHRLQVQVLLLSWLVGAVVSLQPAAVAVAVSLAASVSVEEQEQESLPVALLLVLLLPLQPLLLSSVRTTTERTRPLLTNPSRSYVFSVGIYSFAPTSIFTTFFCLYFIFVVELVFRTLKPSSTRNSDHRVYSRETDICIFHQYCLPSRTNTTKTETPNSYRKSLLIVSAFPLKLFKPFLSSFFLLSPLRERERGTGFLLPFLRRFLFTLPI